MKKYIVGTIMTIALVAGAQDKTKPVVPQPQPEKQERLTRTEVLAINDVGGRLSAAERDAANVIADIQKAHPGYTFDFRTGQLVKLVPMLKPEAQPKVETETKTVPEVK